jgi:broad specificity phosphatase PhoE
MTDPVVDRAAQAVREIQARADQYARTVEAHTAALRTATEAKVTLGQVDAVLRALLQSHTAETFRDVEQLLLRGLQTVFAGQWGAVTITCTQRGGRLWAELSLVKEGGIAGAPLDTFGGGPASVVAFLLRVLVVRRLKLAPVLLLDETFAQVSADYVPALAQFLRLLVEKLHVTILLVTHQPAFAEAAHRVYRVRHDGTQALIAEVKHETTGE